MDFKFFRNKKGKVKVNNCISKEVFLLAGVQQGSIFSLILYIFDIKDMLSTISEEIISSFYADDTAYMYRQTMSITEEKTLSEDTFKPY